MDKGLKIIEQLKRSIEKLSKDKNLNQEKLDEVLEKLDIEEKNLKVAELSLSNLNNEKLEVETAPMRYKEDKKEFKKVLAILITMLSIIGVIFYIMNSIVNIAQIKTFFKVAYGLLVAGTVGATIIERIFVHSNRKANKSRNIEEIEKDIKEKELELQTVKNKILQLVNEKNSLEESKTIITGEITQLTVKINSINEIRSKVIEEFCKDNQVLDNLLNNAYNEEFENDNKQKVKNNGNN